jgi:hypothetical protein
MSDVSVAVLYLQGCIDRENGQREEDGLPPIGTRQADQSPIKHLRSDRLRAFERETKEARRALSNIKAKVRNK